MSKAMRESLKAAADKLRASKSLAPVYCSFADKRDKLGAFVDVESSTGVLLSVDFYDASRPGLPDIVWHGRAVRLTVPPRAHRDSLAAVLLSEPFAACLGRVLVGYSEVLGADNKFSGRYSYDAMDAVSEAEILLGDVDQVEVRTWCEHVAEDLDTLHKQPDKECARKWAAELIAMAEHEGVVIDESPEECVKQALHEWVLQQWREHNDNR